MNHSSVPAAGDAHAAPSPADLVGVHGAFCQLGLPVRGGRGAWHRAVATAAIRIDPPEAEEMLPSGALLRLILIHICDAALRSGNAVVELGQDVSDFASNLRSDAKPQDLRAHLHRLLASRISVSVDGGPECHVFDARSRPRGDGSEWRSTVRLNSRFLASLAKHAVRLDRRVVAALAQSALALDLYAWACFRLGGAEQGAGISVTWHELLQRFGGASQGMAAFRRSVEEAARLVLNADATLRIDAGDEAVSFHHAAAAPPLPPPAPEPPPTPEPPPVPPAPTGQQAASCVPAAAAAPPPAAEVQDPGAADVITQQSVSLPAHLTGLGVCVWLRRGNGDLDVLVGVTPTPRFDANRLTVLAVEPMVLQISGGLQQQDFDRVSAWIMVNRDLIDAFWEGRLDSFAELHRRIRRAPLPGWR